MTWVIFALGAAIFSSAAQISKKKALYKEHAMEFSAVLAVVTLTLSLPLIYFANFSNVSLVTILIMFVGSFMGAIAFIALQKSIRHMELSTVTPLLTISPGILAIMAFLLLGESLSRFQVLGIILIIVGAYIIETKKGHSFFWPLIEIRRSKYIHYIILGLLLFSITGTIDRYLLGGGRIDPISFLVLAQIFLAFHAILFLSIFHDGIKGIKHGFKTMGWSIWIIGIFTIGYRLLQYQAIKLIAVSVVAAVKNLSVLITVIVGGKMYHEHSLLKKTIAASIMITGVTLIVL